MWLPSLVADQMSRGILLIFGENVLDLFFPETQRFWILPPVGNTRRTAALGCLLAMTIIATRSSDHSMPDIKGDKSFCRAKLLVLSHATSL